MMSFSSASTSAARAHTSTSRRSASSSATTRTSAVTRPWIVSSSAAHPVPGTSDATSLVSMPWRNAARSAPAARTTVRKPRSTTAAPSRNAAYSAAGSSPKRRGNTTPRSAPCTAPRAARCECSAVSSIAPAAMRRPLRLDKRPTAGDAAPVSWRDRHRERLATAPEALGVVRPGDTVAVASFSNTPHTLCRALAARTVIGEVHEDFIRTGGDSWAPVERFRHLVPADEPTGMAATAPRTEEETAATEVICTLVAHELVRDRDTLQVGIGTVSSALGLYLDHRHDLGVQSEAITGGIPDLVRRGVVTGRHKVLHPGVVVGSFMLGLTPEELAFVDGHPGFALYGFGSTDDVSTLLRERNLTAVNNALLVDLTGQVASEGIGTHLWSGVGGQAAFAIAAAYSPGGRAIFVLPSAHRTVDGLRSRLVPVLPPGTPVTLPRGFVDYVVTEHGIATLRGKTLRQRVEELLAVAHPDFRAELRAEARRVYCW